MAALNFDFSGEVSTPGLNQEAITPDTFWPFADCRFGVYSVTWDEDGAPVKEVGRNPASGQRYSPNRFDTSLSMDEAMAEIAWLRESEPSKVHGPILYMPEGLVCVDLDNTDSPTTDAIIQNSHYHLLENAPTWIERSVSGVGYHAFYWLTEVEEAQLANTNNGAKQVDTRVVNGFIFLTGDVIDDGEIAPFSTLPTGFQKYLFDRCGLSKEATQGSNAQWRDNEAHNDFDVMVQMFKHCPDTASYMYTMQSQTGGSEKHFQVLLDLIRYSLNYEQVKRLYLNSPCAEWTYRSENRAGQSASTYERWLTNNIHNAAAELEATGRMFNPEDIFIAIGDEEQDEFETQWTSDVNTYTPTDWIVHNIIPAKGVASIYGPSGSGKTFLALDMLSAISSGHEWFGHKTRQVPVTYVGLEGEAGLRNRVYAYRKHHGEVGKMLMITQGIDILNAEHREKLLRTIIRNGQRGGVLCIDTMAKSAPGMNENDSSEMSRYIVAVEALAKEIHGCVILIHHSGKDTERGPRGHSSFLAGIDSAVAVARDGETGARSWNTKKVKDGSDDSGAGFVLKAVEVGTDQWGQPDMSCVVEQAPDIAEFVDNVGTGIAQAVPGIPDADCEILASFMNSVGVPHFSPESRSPYHPHGQLCELAGWPGWERKHTVAVVQAGISRGYFEVYREADGYGNEKEYVRSLI